MISAYENPVSEADTFNIFLKKTSCPEFRPFKNMLDNAFLCQRLGGLICL